MRQIIDISHPIYKSPSCTFAAMDATPQLSFEEGDSHGVTFITSRIDNLHSNTCTHIDFPGHLSVLGRKFPKPVGMYPVERFFGRAFIADFSHKTNAIAPYFDTSGRFTFSPRDGAGIMRFLELLESLVITKNDLIGLFAKYEVDAASLSGLIIYSGFSSWWRYEKFESWEYIYFYSPFLDEEACDWLISNKVSFVGIDAFQLEHPIINFNGYELPLVLNREARDYVAKRLRDMNIFCNHKALLGRDILIYENLNVPSELKNRVVEFYGQPLNMCLEGINDNALARPCVSIV